MTDPNLEPHFVDPYNKDLQTRDPDPEPYATESVQAKPQMREP